MTQVRWQWSVVGFLLFAAACKNEASGEDGGSNVKHLCKMNQQCWICPSEEAQKKCILNPLTSGCKQGSPSDCR